MPLETGVSMDCAEVVKSACIAPEIEKVLWGIRLAGAAQLDHCLQMESLGKKVGERDGLDCVSRGDERAKVAGQGCRVAGDVDKCGGGDLCEQRRDIGAEAGAGRVQDNQVGAS